MAVPAGQFGVDDDQSAAYSAACPISRNGRISPDMCDGNVVVISNGNSAFRAEGVVIGPNEFVGRGGVDEHHHRRCVRCTWIEAASLPVSTIMECQLTQQPIYRIAKSKLKPDALAAYLTERAAPEHLPHVLIIDEINRAKSSRVLASSSRCSKRTSNGSI